MSIEITTARSEQPEVWIGLVEVVALSGCELEEISEVVGALVNVFVLTDNADDYVERVTNECRIAKLKIRRIEDVRPLSELDENSVEKVEDELTIFELGKIAEETREVVFDTFAIFEEDESAFEVLERAIIDIGYWSWWAGDFPNSVRIEFNGVQLWSEEPQQGQPPRGVVALHFSQPTSVSFLTRNAATDDLPSNWPDVMYDDALDYRVNIRDEGELHFNDAEFVKRVLDGAQRIDVRFGVHPQSEEFFDAPVTMALWAGDIGCAVSAQKMTLLLPEGEVELDEVAERHQKWWKYWEEYWEVRGTDKAFAEDYACECTVPIDAFAGEGEEQ